MDDFLCEDLRDLVGYVMLLYNVNIRFLYLFSLFKFEL